VYVYNLQVTLTLKINRVLHFNSLFSRHYVFVHYGGVWFLTSFHPMHESLYVSGSAHAYDVDAMWQARRCEFS